jgi:hypothetical protein
MGVYKDNLQYKRRSLLPGTFSRKLQLRELVIPIIYFSSAAGVKSIRFCNVNKSYEE